MKKRVKLMLSAVITLALAAFFQIETSKADIIIPVEGCRYTENPNDYCRVGNSWDGYMYVFYCTNYIGTTSCGIEVEVPE